LPPRYRAAHTGLSRAVRIGILAPQVTTTFTLMGLVTILSMQRVQHLTSPRSRIICGLALQLGVFLVIFGFSAAPLALPTEQLASFLRRTSTPLFAVTVAGVALAGFAQAVITGSLFTYATLYARPTYLQAISAGMGVAGLSVSLGSLVTALPQTAQACGAAGDEADTAQVDRATVVGAAVYFGLSCVLLGLCLVAFLVLERLPFTLECKRREALLSAAEERRLAAARPSTEPETEVPLSLADVAGAARAGGGAAGEEAAAAAAAAAGVAAKAAPPALLPRLWAWALSLTLIYAVTLGLFPSLTSTIQSTAAACSWQHMFVPVQPRTAPAQPPHSRAQPRTAAHSPAQPPHSRAQPRTAAHSPTQPHHSPTWRSAALRSLLPPLAAPCSPTHPVIHLGSPPARSASSFTMPATRSAATCPAPCARRAGCSA